MSKEKKISENENPVPSGEQASQPETTQAEAQQETTPQPDEANHKPEEGGDKAEPQAAQPDKDKEIENLKQELEKFRDLALRSQADLDNYRKRMAREKEEAIRYANAGLLEGLLPVVDSFELGLEAARNTSGAEGILQGMEMVFKQLKNFLASNGVEIIDATGQVFDPSVHDAMGQEASDEVPEGHVLRQLRKGYKLRDRLLRPSSVIVSKGKAKE